MLCVGLVCLAVSTSLWYVCVQASANMCPTTVLLKLVSSTACISTGTACIAHFREKRFLRSFRDCKVALDWTGWNWRSISHASFCLHYMCRWLFCLCGRLQEQNYDGHILHVGVVLQINISLEFHLLTNSPVAPPTLTEEIVALDLLEFLFHEASLEESQEDLQYPGRHRCVTSIQHEGWSFNI